MEKEIWKDIKNYERFYQISNLGNIKNYRNKLLQPRINKSGYNRVILHKDKHGKEFLVHRLVAEAFIPNPNNLPCINHKDENKANNCVENLEWCTQKYNSNYGNIRIKQHNTRLKNKKLKEAGIDPYKENDNVIKKGRKYRSFGGICVPVEFFKNKNF